MKKRFTRRPSRLKTPPGGLNRLTMSEVGLTHFAVAIIGLISLLPFVGLIVGGYYSAQSHYQTRSFGRLLFSFAIILHFIYGCFLCPALLYFSTRQFF